MQLARKGIDLCPYSLQACVQPRSSLWNPSKYCISSLPVAYHTLAHTDPGPGEFLCALVNHARSTYTATALLYIELAISCRKAINATYLRILASLNVNFRSKYDFRVQVTLSQSWGQGSPCDST